MAELTGFFRAVGEARARDRRSLLRAQRKAREGPSTSDIIKQTLLGAALKPVGEMLGEGVSGAISSKYERLHEDFENTEQVRNVQKLFKEDEENTAFISKINTQKRESGLSENEWWEVDTYDRTLAELQRQVSMRPEVRDPQHFDMSIRAKARDFAAANWEKRKAAFDLAAAEMKDASSSEDLNKKVALANRRPRNILEEGFGAAKRMFTGKTKEQIDQEAFDQIKNSALYKENEEFRNAYYAYKQSGTYEGLEEIAKEVKINPSIVNEETTQDIRVVGRQIVVITGGVRTTLDPDGSYRKEPIRDIEVKIDKDLSTGADKVKALQGGNPNLYSASRALLKGDSFIAFAKKLENNETVEGNADPINIVQIATPEHYMRATEIFQTFLKTEHMQDKFQDAIDAATISQLVGLHKEAQEERLLELRILRKHKNPTDAQQERMAALTLELVNSGGADWREIMGQYTDVLRRARNIIEFPLGD